MTSTMAADLACDKFWVNKSTYHDAEKSYYEGLTKDGVGATNVSKDYGIKPSLAGEVAKARQLIKTSMQQVDGITSLAANDKSSACNMNNADFTRLMAVMTSLESCIEKLDKRVQSLEERFNSALSLSQTKGDAPKAEPPAKAKGDDDDDDVDLFGSDSEEENDEAKKIREQRLAEYAAKKSKKPALIAKSNIILDIKPWEDTTDMKMMEESVRKVEMDGLVWGASKLVPLAFGIYKLQISCVVEDDKVSVDQLTETLREIEEYIQSVDIAAFNKV